MSNPISKLENATALVETRVPAEIRNVLGKPPLLANEDQNEYHYLLGELANEVRPSDIIEWLWVKDIADLTWEILRYRRIKTAHTNGQFKSAIAQRALPGLERDHKAAAQRGAWTERLAAHREAPALACDEANRLANNYLTDAKTGEEVDARLKARGLDADAIMAESFIAAVPKLVAIDKMLESVELRRNLTLREIERRRAFLGHALRQASDKVVDSDTPPGSSMPAVRPLN
jgi:hypothetical protein